MVTTNRKNTHYQDFHHLIFNANVPSSFDVQMKNVSQYPVEKTNIGAFTEIYLYQLDETESNSCFLT